MEKHITVPYDEGTAKQLRSGDYVYITGTIYTARDAAHKRPRGMILLLVIVFQFGNGINKIGTITR